jgi:hypothetical protein
MASLNTQFGWTRTNPKPKPEGADHQVGTRQAGDDKYRADLHIDC